MSSFTQQSLIEPIVATSITAIDNTNYLKIPADGLAGFENTLTTAITFKNGREAYLINGNIDLIKPNRICPECGDLMHVHDVHPTNLMHIPFGSMCSKLHFNSTRFFCPGCKHSEMQEIPFKAEGHRITLPLLKYIESLLAANRYTLKDIADRTGLHANTIKEIDKKRLIDLYTTLENGSMVLKKLDDNVTYLGIDEFLLHKGNKYATHIINLQTGAILWISEGKKKQVVYDFIEHYGLEWMKNVKAVACDMNSDFEEAFLEKCPHLQIVYDHFHIVKNFNDKVVSAVRKDEQKRLEAEGDKDGAKSLKKSRFILTSSRKTLQEKDQEAAEGKEIKKGSELFKSPSVQRKGGLEARYDSILAANKLLFTAALIKAMLEYAYTL